MSKDTQQNFKSNYELLIQKIIEKPIIGLGILAIIGIFIRVLYYPYGLPLTLDSLMYFWYANDMSIIGGFPTNYSFPNNGWPTILSFFFSMYHSENFLDYMNIQRTATILISVLTIIPIFLTCKKFVRKEYSLIASAIFVLDPRIIQNSLSGLTEPLFIFLGITSILFFLSDKQKIIFFAFVTAAIFALIRYEGLLIIIPFSIMYFIRFKVNKNIFLKYCIMISVFILILTPMANVRTEITGNDGLLSHIIAGPESVIVIENRTENTSSFFLEQYIKTSLENFFKFFGWILLPTFIFFIPLSIFYILKDKKDIFNHKVISLFLIGIFLLLPALYAYGREIQETRYLFIIFPILCIISSYVVSKINKKIIKTNLIIIVIICGILLSSIIFLEYKKVNYEYEHDAYLFAKKIIENTNVINSYYPEGGYLRVASLSNYDFPILKESITENVIFISSDNAKSLEEFLKSSKELKLTHLAIDKKYYLDSNRNDKFLGDIYNNEKAYPYLEKIFDSEAEGYTYHMKIFKINYDKFMEENYN